ncbi:anti-sigma factor antagonist [bacterium CPR1]|nr:anti-sigma factor antagonist [bacterium CPR1]
MHIQLAQLEDQSPCLSVHGSLNYQTHDRLKDRIQECMLAGHTRVCLDLTETDQLDLNGLSVLIAARRELLERGGALQILAVSRPVARVLDLVNLRWLLS